VTNLYFAEGNRVGTDTAVPAATPGIQLRVSRLAAFVLVVGALYVLGAETSFWLESSASTGVAFFPAAGVTLAALAILPRNRWPWVLATIVVAETAVDLRHGQTLAMALGFAAANAVEPYVGATLLRKTYRINSTLKRYFTRYAVYAVLVGPMVGAAIGATVASLAGSSDPGAWIATKWWIGDALGVLVIATCVLAWLEQARHHVDPVVSWPEIVLFPVLAAGVTLVTILVWHRPVIYIVLPVLMWSALRGGFSLVTTTGLAMALVAEVAVGTGHARDALSTSQGSQLLYLQLFLAVALLSGLMLAIEVGERNRAQRSLRTAHAARLLARVDALDAAAEERRHIAGEVHDIVGHALNAVVLQAGGARRVLDKDPPLARELIESIESTGRDAFRDLDAALGLVDNSPDLAPSRSIADLPDLVGALRRAGLDVNLTIIGEPRPLPRLVEWSAFRIVQEALTNVVKHTADAHARVEVGYEPETLALVVANDGRSVNGVATNGRGVIGMRERASVLGGEIEIGPDERGHFTVRARIPVKKS
jgi:signal transduction histidine kinase